MPMAGSDSPLEGIGLVISGSDLAADSAAASRRPSSELTPAATTPAMRLRRPLSTFRLCAME